MAVAGTELSRYSGISVDATYVHGYIFCCNELLVVKVIHYFEIFQVLFLIVIG